MINSVSKFFYQPAWGMLLIRVAIGMVFVVHGLQKAGSLEGTILFMGAIGLPFPMVAAYLITAIEIIGGLMLISGFALRPAAVALGIAMLVAASKVGWPGGGYDGAQWEILLALASFGLAMTGAGKLRLMSIFEHDRDDRASSMATPTAGTGM